MSKIKVLLMSAVLALSVLVPIATLAQQETTTGSGLSISPTRTDLVVNPGTSADLTISLKNVTGGNVTAKAFINDFESDGVTGEPKLIVDETQEVVGSIKKFTQGLSDIPLATGESKDIVLKINIPDDASPGAYYGVVRYQAVPEGSSTPGDGQVALTASVGSIVLIEVPGNITEKIRINSVKAFAGDKGGSFLTSTPDQVGIEIENLGNGFARPFGRVEVKGMFNKMVKAYEVNNTNPRGVVLPESTRVFKDNVEGIKWPGRYSVQANISHGRGGEILTVNQNFWYLPVWFLLIVLAVVGALVLAATVLYRRYISQSVTKRKR
ncbi:MAG: hypothetical protein M3Q79_02580 [bacterium]|nr:hypothetical protein [bacterium]